MAYTIPVIIVGGCCLPGVISPATNTLIILPFRYHHWRFGAHPYLLWSGGNQRCDIWYFASGGVIGSLLSTTLHHCYTVAGELLRCSAFGQRADAVHRLVMGDHC